MNVRTVHVLTLLSLSLAPRSARVDAQASSAAPEGVGSTGVDAEIADKRRALETQRARHAALAAELSALPRVRAALEESLRRDVRALYRLQRSGLMPLAGGLSSLMSHASRVAHLTRMAERANGELQSTHTSALKLAQDASESEARVAAITDELASLERERARLAADEALASATASVPTTSLPDARMSYGLTMVGGAPKPGAFAAQRGSLALPITAAARVEPDAGGKRLKLAASPGASVRAAADGRVVAVGPDASGGTRVIVEHEPPYRTLYGGLQSADVQAGDAISKSARIGVAGTAPVTFEVQSGVRSLDARTWLGL